MSGFSKMVELFSSLLLIKYSQRSQMQHFIDDKYSQQKKATLTFYPSQNYFLGSNSPILFGWFFLCSPMNFKDVFYQSFQGEKNQNKTKKQTKTNSAILLVKFRKILQIIPAAEKKAKHCAWMESVKSGCPSPNYCFIICTSDVLTSFAVQSNQSCLNYFSIFTLIDLSHHMPAPQQYMYR